MKQAIIDTLLSLNKQFYETVEFEFDGTRKKPWDGWYKLLPQVWQLSTASTILDLGCGNGRFGEFLLHYMDMATYIGIDQNETLLKIAKNKIPSGQFFALDITDNQSLKSVEAKADIISLIAVLHHIPSFHSRATLLKTCSQKLRKGGLIIFTAWQFLSIEQLKNRVVDWGVVQEIDQGDLETHDYLIDWQRGQHALRYCHLITAKEIEELTGPLQLTKVAQFFADGKDGKSNIYVVLQKE